MQFEVSAMLFLFSVSPLLNCLKLQLLLQNGNAYWLDVDMVEIIFFIYSASLPPKKKSKVTAL